MNVLPIKPMDGTHLVVGAGEVGSQVASLLADAGLDVVLVTRTGSGPGLSGIRRVAADARSTDALLAAAPDAVAIYNCANPQYTEWPKDWPPLATSFLRYAEKTGAVLATCSNLYVYGPVTIPMTEDLPLNTQGIKGRIRAQMWLDAKAAHYSGRIRATEVRGSDYIAPGPNSRLGQRVMPNILKGKSVQLLGGLDHTHTWTAPIDVARTLISVAASEIAWGKPWHVPSNAPRTQREAIADIANAAGVQPVKVSSIPTPLFKALGLVNPLLRELRETSFQFERPFVLDDSAARNSLGLTPTPWKEVLTDLVANSRPRN
jgi:nucleoside-diphosphate-sugar epimerase